MADLGIEARMEACTLTRFETMKTIVDSVKNPLTRIVNIRVRTQYEGDLASFFKSQGYRFDRSDVTFLYQPPGGPEESVKPILLHEFNDSMPAAISAWDAQQK